MLDITFSNAVYERTGLEGRYDLLIGVAANLRVAVASRVVYSEPDFPIVELRVALDRWLRDGQFRSGDFEFESMESDEVGLVWIRRQSSSRWRIGSVHQDDLAPEEIIYADIVSGCRAFIEYVDGWVLRNLALEVSNVVAI